MQEAYSNELYHYGILGQKWGIRRFQNPDGTLTAAGRKRYGTVQNLMAGRTKRQTEKLEKEKQAAIKSGDVKKVQKYSSEMTKTEIAEAFRRINDEQRLSDLRLYDAKNSQAKLDQVLGRATSVKTALELTKNMYNLTAEVYNAFSKDGKKLPIIGEKKEKPKASDLKILYDLGEKKKADARSAWFENELRNHDFDYFKENSSKFSTDELRAVRDRFEQKDSMFKSPEPGPVNSSWTDQIKWDSKVPVKEATMLTPNEINEINTWTNKFTNDDTPVSSINQDDFLDKHAGVLGR